MTCTALTPFPCFSHSPTVQKIVSDIVDNNDVVHCQSSGYFPVLPRMVAGGVAKPLVLESPVVRFLCLVSGYCVTRSWLQVQILL